MKLKKVVLMACVFLLSASAAQAWQQVITDTTLVQPWLGNKVSTYPGYTNWMDIIGDPNIFETPKVILTVDPGTSKVNYQIFTNFPKTGDPDYSMTKVADLFFDFNQNSGTYNYAVILRPDGHDGFSQGDVVRLSQARSAQDIYGGYGNLIYGGRYNQSNPLISYTEAVSGNLLSQASVSWNPGNAIAKYEIDISFTAPAGANQTFFFGTGNCSNDGVSNVPVPASVLLLGSGLLGLAMLRWRKGKGKLTPEKLDLGVGTSNGA